MAESGASVQEEVPHSSELSFGVLLALRSPWFCLRNPDPGFCAEEIQKSSSVSAMCLKCGPDVPARAKTVKVSIKSTSNLFFHLKKNHDPAIGESFREWLKDKRATLQDQNPRRASETRVRRSSVSLQGQFNEALINFVSHTMVPLSLVGDSTFEDMLNVVGFKRQSLKLISRRTLGRRMDLAYAESLRLLRSVLSRAAWVSTTADIWSGGKRSFLGMTIHWIDEGFHRRSAGLACRRFTGTHSFDRIAQLISDIHESFDLPALKITATVTDNASNFIKAFVVFGVDSANVDFDSPLPDERAVTDEIVPSAPSSIDSRSQHGEDQDTEQEGESTAEEEELDEEEEDGFESDEDDENSMAPPTWVSLEEEVSPKLPSHIRCAAHTLSLCASTDLRKVLDRSPNLTARHGAALSKCNTLWKLSRRPKSAEIIKKITGRNLPRPVITRWNSLFDSLTAMVGLRLHIATLRRDLKLQTSLDEGDFAYLEEFLKCARPIAAALDKLQGDVTAFYGTLLPTLFTAKRQLIKVAQTELRFWRPIVEGFGQSLESRFEDVLNCRTSLGEKAAIAALTLPSIKKRWFGCISAENQNSILRRFKEVINDRLRGTEAIPEPAPEPMEVDDYDLGEEEAEWLPTSADANIAETTANEYLSDKGVDFNMLKKYPAVEAISREYNTAPPSSAEVERLFSFATMINAPKSNRLSDIKFEQRLMLKRNGALLREIS